MCSGPTGAPTTNPRPPPPPVQVAFGEHVSVVGSDESLGGWEVARGPELNWSEGHVWSAVVEVPAEVPLEYKFVQVIQDWWVLG